MSSETTTASGPGPVDDRGEAVCVIGAGGSGLAAVKNLRERGFAVDCYERETGVGGVWNWRHDRSPVYASMHPVTSKPCTQYPDFPMPDHWPDYPHHSQLLAYFERYADHFGLREHIWFGSEVTSVEPAGDGTPRWDVSIRGQSGGAARTTRYTAVVVANGHTWSPKLPEYPGLADFRGTVLHASGYTDPAQLRGRKVLVVGAGNTGCDLAVEAAQAATACWHSARRGYWYLPRYLFGRPTDQVDVRAQALRLPLWLRRWLLRRVLALSVGDLTRFGLPAPDHRIFETHPIVNSQLVHHLGHGGITPLPDVAHFGRHDVTLVDGRVVDPDLVILATGYLPRFEFLRPDLLDADEAGRPQLRWHIFPPGHPTLAVVGLPQPDTNRFACAHWQSVLVANWLRVLDAAPERAREFWGRHRADDGRRYHAARLADSSRHWFEINHLVYLRALERALNELEAIA